MPRPLASLARWAPRSVARAGAFALLVLLLLVELAGPASAHASLLNSDPADGAVLGSAPHLFHLSFSEPVELGLSRIELQRPDGTHLQLGAPRAVPGKSGQVEVPVPDIARGSYVISWHAATRDTHIASGQILFGLGAAVPQGFKSAGGGSHVLAWTAGAARLAWYLALTLSAGMLFAWAWARGRGARPSRSGDPDGELIAEVGTTAGRGLALAGAALVGASALRLGLLLWQAATNAGAERSALSAARGVLLAYQGRVWAAVLVASVVALLLARRLVRRSEDRAGTLRGPVLVLAASLLGLCSLEVATGHAATRPAPVEGVVVTALHLGAVAVWAGTLAAFVVITRRRSYRRHAAPHRVALTRAFLRGFSPVATAALAVLVASGVWLAGVSLGPVAKLATTAYGKTLGLKVGLLFVAAALGLYHRQSVSSPKRGAGSVARSRAGGRPGARTVALEAGVLVAALTAAAGLTGLQPAGQVISLRRAQSQAQLVVARPVDCQRTPAFLLGCWQRYFEATTRKKGAETALADLDGLSHTGPYAEGQCHQLAHVVGRVAARRYTSLATGLAAGQRLGNICFSGYFHGLLEAYTSALTDSELKTRIDHICDQPGVKRYSFDNYTCVHGLGHGITLRYQNDVFKALPWCDSMADPWDRQSCYTGVFMQNLIADQVEGTAVDIRPSDPVFPCNAVTEEQKPSCYVMVTSNILKQANWDYRAGFAACQSVEHAYEITCYESMGRDISSRELLDGPKTIDSCRLASKDVAFRSCVDAAAKNDISTDHNGDKAAALCQIAPGDAQTECFKVRTEYLKQF